MSVRELLIGGSVRAAASGGQLDVVAPAHGRVVAQVADATAADARAALACAAEAQAAWGRSAPAERADALLRAWELLRARREQLAAAIVLETGKPLREARAEVDYAGDYLRWYAEEAVRLPGTMRPRTRGDGWAMTRARPVGPCLLVTPWNFPLAMAARKVAPALAAGCTFVLKPAEQTPLSALALGELLGDAGVPAGVASVLPTSDPAGVVDALLAEPALRKLSFTGSTEVGRALLARCAPAVLRTSMELGGNAPFVVLADADLDVAVECALVAKLRNAGQACTAANRFLVADAVADDFARRLAGAMAARRLGPGDDPASDVGPLIDADAVARVEALVADARAGGARQLSGEEPPPSPGFFARPAVLADVPQESRLVCEEIFGPVAPIVRFGDVAEAVALANDTVHGLAAYVCAGDAGQALEVADALETGMVAINAGSVSDATLPFGGVKQSGLGREGGGEGLRDYLETQALTLAR